MPLSTNENMNFVIATHFFSVSTGMCKNLSRTFCIFFEINEMLRKKF
jgi:hypothetical protein